jgi:hypothetical protein
MRSYYDWYEDDEEYQKRQIEEHFEWMDRISKLPREEDETGRKVLTNFDNSKLEIFKETIRRFDRVEETGIMIKKNHAKDVYGKSLNEKNVTHSSLWNYKSCSDLSDFWRLNKQVEKEFENRRIRTEKLKRILK